MQRMLTLPTKKNRQVCSFRDYVARMVVGVRRCQWEVQERVGSKALWINIIRRVSEGLRHFTSTVSLIFSINNNRVQLLLKSNWERN